MKPAQHLVTIMPPVAAAPSGPGMTDVLAVSRTARGWLLVGVIAIAAALRFAAIAYGLPGVYNPDEIPILNRALTFAKGDPNPHNFLYPSLYFYMLFAWQGLYFVTGYITGAFASLGAFQRAYFQDPSGFILAGRALTATCGVITVVATYRFGRAMAGPAAGLVAALCLATAPFAVRDAHYVKLDVPVAMFAALTLASIAITMRRPDDARDWRRWLLAGALAGLTVSTHYYAIFIIVPIVVAAIALRGREGSWLTVWNNLVVAGLASIGGFLVGTPFIVVEPATAMRDMIAVREIDIDRAVVGTAPFASIGSYLHMLWTDALGWPVFAAALVGFVAAVAGDRGRGLMLASFPIAFLAFAANTVPMSRYLNVMLPPLAVAAAIGVVTIARAIAMSGRATGDSGRRVAIVTAVLAGLAVAPGLANSVRSDRFFAADDTRSVALAWVQQQIPAGASILTQPYSVPLHRTRESLVEALRANLGSEANATIKFQGQLNRSPYPSPAYRLLYLGEAGGDPPPDVIYISPRAFDGDHGLQPLRDRGVNYVIVKRGNVPNPSLAGLDAALARDADRLAVFTPYRDDVDAERRAAVPPYLHNTAARIDPALERPGPAIEIWRVR
jgi:hypothetical protein